MPILKSDADGAVVFESGAILIYLAEKTGKLLPADPVARLTALQWLMWQMGGVGPMFGQWNHFASYAPEKIPYAIDRYTNEVKRLYRVLDKRLSQAEYLAGDEYSIADIATFPWTRGFERRGLTADEIPHVKRWLDAIEARPAVQRGLAVLSDKQRKGPMTEAEKEVMFGKTQFAQR